MSAIGNQIPIPVPPPEKLPPPSAAPGAGHKKVWIWLTLLVIIVSAVGAYELWFKPMRAAQQAAKTAVVIRTAKVTRGEVVRTSRVTGQTSARNFANIIAPLLRGPEAGRDLLLMKIVKSGSRVKKGDLLAEIDAQTSKDHLDDTIDTVKQAENDIGKKKASQAVEWETLQQTLRVAKSDFDKWTLEARASEVRTVLDQEIIKIQMEEAGARYKQQLQDQKSKKESFNADLRILEITLIRQKHHLDRNVTDLKKFTIISPMDGLAVMQTLTRGSDTAQIQEGDRVSPGQPFMKVVNLASMQVEASVNQAESGFFKVGLPATIGLDAFPGLTVKGKIYSIGALAAGGYRGSFFIRNVPLRLTIESVDPRLIPDLSASGDVVIAKEQNALIVPVGAVRSKGGKSYVSVRTAQGFEDRDVEVTLASYIQAAVTGNIKEGDEVKLD